MRRIHAGQPLIDRSGQTMALAAAQAHHARDVLRLRAGDAVELFDDAGNTAASVIGACNAQRVEVIVGPVRERLAPGTRFGIAAAVPKGARADWMIEKLAELGAAFYIPLISARSVVTPEGKNKMQRWQRLAEEAARQSHAAGVMRIEPVTPLPLLLESHARSGKAGLFFSTDPGARPVLEVMAEMRSRHRDPAATSTLLIGPEGGWTPEEVALLGRSGLTACALTTTILRIETAAIAAAAVVGMALSAIDP